MNLKSGEPCLSVRPVGVASTADLVAVHPVPLAVRLVQAAADPERPPIVARDCFDEKVNVMLLGTSYRVTEVVVHLGWVDFDLGCCTMQLVLAAQQPGDNSRRLSYPNRSIILHHLES